MWEKTLLGGIFDVFWPYLCIQSLQFSEMSYTYSKTCLKRTCSNADTCLKWARDLVSRYSFTGQSLTIIICLKRTSF